MLLGDVGGADRATGLLLSWESRASWGRAQEQPRL